MRSREQKGKVKWRNGELFIGLGSITTEAFVKADSKEEAIAEFEKSNGKDKDAIINIEEIW